MNRIGRYCFKPNRSWECNARWQYDGKRFQLSVPMYGNHNAIIVPRIEAWNWTKSDVTFEGFLIEEYPSPNKIVDIEYNGTKGWKSFS